MDPKRNQNITTNRDNNFNTLQTSPTATPSNHSSTNHPSTSASNISSPRRSVRLSTQSPKKTSSSSLHRTISGGVGNHSPKLNVRKRTSVSTDIHGTSSSSLSSITYSTITSNDNGYIQDGSNNNNSNNRFSRTRLPSDQSDDEEILSNNNAIAQQTPTGLANRAKVLSFYIKQDNGYKCKLCNKIYQSTKSSDANLRKHLSNASHRIPNMLFVSQANDNSTSQISIIPAERKRELHEAAINCIIRDGLPFGVFRQPGMSQFLQTAVPGYVGPHRHTVRKTIGAAYSSYTQRLRTILSQVDLLALTCDLWKSSQRVHYISLTGHILTGKYENVSLVLGCRRIIGRHLSPTIQKYIEYELNRLHIKREQIIGITTDNGSDVKQATTTFRYGNRYSCMGHNLNLVVKNGLCLWNEPKADEFPLDLDFDSDEWEEIDDIDDDGASVFDQNMVDVATDLMSDEDESDSEKSDNNDIDETTEDEFQSDSENDFNISTLSVNSTQPSSIDHYELLLVIFKLMTKTRAGIQFIRNHNVTNEHVMKHIKSKFNGQNVGRLVLDLSIRWNSSCVLLDRLLMHRDIVINLFAFPNNLNGLTEKQKNKLHELTIKQNEWEILNAVRHVLEPFLIATTVLSGQNYPTMGSAFFVWRLLSHFLHSTSNDQPIILALKESLRSKFNTYCNTKLPPGQLETMKMAAFLDPTIYNLLNDDDRKSAKKLIFKRMKDLTTNSVRLPSSPTPLLPPTTTKANPLQQLALICGHTVNLTTSMTSKRPMTIDEELSAYIEAARSTTNFQEFWINHEKSLPRLARLTRRLNVLPATSVASERLFSVASFLNRKQRSSLSSRTLRYLLVLKDQHVLDKLEQNL